MDKITPDDVQITVYMPSRDPVLVSLNLKDKLSKIRENPEVNINPIHSFIDRSSVEIKREDEVNKSLEEIIKERDLHLEMYPWNSLVKKHELEFALIINITSKKFKKAKKKAFTVKHCNMIEIDNNRGNKTFKTHLNDNWKDLLLTADNKDIEESGFVTNSAYNVIEHSRLSLKLQLEPTDDFIKEVKEAIDSKNPKKFKEITESFGQFIPREVILGGREYHENSDKDLFESLKDLRNWKCIKFKNPISIFGLLEENLRKKILPLIGKKILYMKSTEYCTEITNCGSKLCDIPKETLKFVQNEEVDCNIFATVVDKEEVKNDIFNCQILWPSKGDPKLIIHCIQKKFKKRNCKLEIRWMVIGYDLNFDFKSNFNGQLEVQTFNFNASKCKKDLKVLKCDSSVLCFGMSKLNKLDPSNNCLTIGHHFFSDKNNREIGFCTFYYCLKRTHYDNNDLLSFDFYMLKISGYPNFKDYGTSHLKHNNIENNLPNFIKSNKLFSFTKSIKPKFISLYSTGQHKCHPIFLKQKINGIKIKYINSCDDEKCICQKKLHILDKNLRYAFFDFNYQGISFC